MKKAFKFLCGAASMAADINAADFVDDLHAVSTSCYY